jgi:hypothetical protein
MFNFILVQISSGKTSHFVSAEDATFFLWGQDITDFEFYVRMSQPTTRDITDVEAQLELAQKRVGAPL